MIMKIVLARDGFCNINPNYLQEDLTAESNFSDCIKKMFNFIDKDLQNFDGVSCTLENSFNPTNSIFIYENEQGKFLYQIQGATPVIHKNKMLWNCNVYNMQNLDEMDEIFKKEYVNGIEQPKKVVFKIIKDLAPRIDFNIKQNADKSANYSNFTSEIKPNFKPLCTSTLPLARGSCTLKIKYFVNPTGNSSLISTESDGSFVFIFPMRVTQIVSGFENGDTFTSAITDGTNTYKLSEIISKYSTMIKTIEVLPFLMKWEDENGNLFNGELLNSTTLKLSGGSVSERFTDAGFFVKNSGVARKMPLSPDVNKINFPTQLVAGGGARGFLQTPIANLPLDFSTADFGRWSYNSEYPFTNVNTINMLGNGFVIDGQFKVVVPPHYINFYTDNAGQVFVNNLTTNAMEARNLVMANLHREELAKADRDFELYGGREHLLGAIRGATKDIFSLGGRATDINEKYDNQSEKRAMEFNHAYQTFKDKIKTESILSKMTGKQIGGDTELSQFLEKVNANFFQFVIETNYFQGGADIDGSNISYIVQKDYDYSISPNYSIFAYRGDPRIHKWEPMGEPQNTIRRNIIGRVFGFVPNYSQTEIINKNAVGANYNLIFSVEEVPTEDNPNKKKKFSNIMVFPIRKEPERITYVQP